MFRCGRSSRQASRASRRRDELRGRSEALAVRIRSLASQPVALPGGGDYRLAISIGAAVYPDDGGDATALLTAADTAMYADKLTNRAKKRQAET